MVLLVSTHEMVFVAPMWKHSLNFIAITRVGRGENMCAAISVSVSNLVTSSVEDRDVNH